MIARKVWSLVLLLSPLCMLIKLCLLGLTKLPRLIHSLFLRLYIPRPRLIIKREEGRTKIERTQEKGENGIINLKFGDGEGPNLSRVKK